MPYAAFGMRHILRYNSQLSSSTLIRVHSRMVGSFAPAPRAGRRIRIGWRPVGQTCAQRAGPAHARSGQSVFEALVAALDRAGADRIVTVVKFLILQAAGMLAEVVRLSGQPSPLEGRDQLVGFAQEQVGAPRLLPGLGRFRVRRLKCFGGTGQIFGGVIPIDNPDAIGKQVRHQVPDPIGAVSHSGRLRHLPLDGQGSQGRGKFFDAAQHRPVEHVHAMHT